MNKHSMLYNQIVCYINGRRIVILHVHLRCPVKSNACNLHNLLMQITGITPKMMQITCKWCEMSQNRGALKNTGSVNRINIDAYVISENVTQMGARPWDCVKRRIAGLPRDISFFRIHFRFIFGIQQLFFITSYESTKSSGEGFLRGPACIEPD